MSGGISLKAPASINRPGSTPCASCGHPRAYHRGPGTIITEPQPEPWLCAHPPPDQNDESPCHCTGFVEPVDPVLIQPDVGTQWISRDNRTCKIVGNRSCRFDCGTYVQLVEFKYRRTVGGMGRNRTTPTQTMPLETWRRLFIKEAP